MPSHQELVKRMKRVFKRAVKEYDDPKYITKAMLLSAERFNHDQTRLKQDAAMSRENGRRYDKSVEKQCAIDLEISILEGMQLLEDFGYNKTDDEDPIDDEVVDVTPIPVVPPTKVPPTLEEERLLLTDSRDKAAQCLIGLNGLKTEHGIVRSYFINGPAQDADTQTVDDKKYEENGVQATVDHEYQDADTQTWTDHTCQITKGTQTVVGLESQDTSTQTLFNHASQDANTQTDVDQGDHGCVGWCDGHPRVSMESSLRKESAQSLPGVRNSESYSIESELSVSDCGIPESSSSSLSSPPQKRRKLTGPQKSMDFPPVLFINPKKKQKTGENTDMPIRYRPPRAVDDFFAHVDGLINMTAERTSAYIMGTLSNYPEQEAKQGLSKWLQSNEVFQKRVTQCIQSKLSRQKPQQLALESAGMAFDYASFYKNNANLLQVPANPRPVGTPLNPPSNIGAARHGPQLHFLGPSCSTQTMQQSAPTNELRPTISQPQLLLPQLVPIQTTPQPPVPTNGLFRTTSLLNMNLQTPQLPLRPQNGITLLVNQVPTQSYFNGERVGGTLNGFTAESLRTAMLGPGLQNFNINT